MSGLSGKSGFNHCQVLIKHLGLANQHINHRPCPPRGQCVVKVRTFRTSYLHQLHRDGAAAGGRGEAAHRKQPRTAPAGPPSPHPLVISQVRSCSPTCRWSGRHSIDHQILRSSLTKADRKRERKVPQIKSSNRSKRQSQTTTTFFCLDSWTPLILHPQTAAPPPAAGERGAVASKAGPGALSDGLQRTGAPVGLLEVGQTLIRT